MSFASPWRHSLYRRSVAAVRLLLRPFAGLERRFIEQRTRRQNRRVRAHLQRHPGARALLIMPRCVQKKGCKSPVQKGLQDCLTCMQCPLGNVAHLCRHHRVEALVAFRSHVAFAMARQRKPDVIIATACHDRLIKALRSVPEFPALLAPLPSMEKMCLNAEVDLVWLEEQLQAVVPPAAAPPEPLVHAAEGS